MDHYRNRRNSAPLERPDIRVFQANPLCGDSVTIDCMVSDGVVRACGVYGSGCVMSQASASLLSQEIVGKTVEECAAFSADTMKMLIGIHVGPMRMECVMLALHALHKGLSQCLITKKL
jgi:nitrogen fixation NifU-like protein